VDLLSNAVSSAYGTVEHQNITMLLTKKSSFLEEAMLNIFYYWCLQVPELSPSHSYQLLIAMVYKD
jgi:hypothetical protein